MWSLIQKLEWLAEEYSLVGDPKFFDANKMPGVSQLEAHWEPIRDELDQILEYRELMPNFEEISKYQEPIAGQDKWKTYFLYGWGEKLEQNCARCPETTRVIEQIPGMSTAFFSILSPGKYIPPHRGPYKGVLRYHLGLKVPDRNESCRIRVGDEVAPVEGTEPAEIWNGSEWTGEEVRRWEEGKTLVFDDTNPHEVWNETDQERAILFLDVLRPLPAPLSTINKALIRLARLSPMLQDFRKNQRMWNEMFEQRTDFFAEETPAT